MRRAESKIPGAEGVPWGIALIAGLWILMASLPVLGQGSPHGELAIECSACHTVEGWAPLRDPMEFDHEDVGRPLDKGHEGVNCVTCHQQLIFAFVPTACADCHEDPHRGELGFDCEVCHRPSSWDNRRSMSDLHGATLFPLTGVHATVDCAACHRREPPFEYALTPTDCLSCHVEDYQRTADPDHVSAGFPTECQFCHNALDWNDAEFTGGLGFDHSLSFQLTGAHAALDCGECHTNGFSGTPTDCVGCHRADYNATSDPNHQQAGFSTRCEDCHGTSTWEGAVVDHNRFWPLTGSHRGLDCGECHATSFAGTPTDCDACHRSDYDRTRNPNHAAAGFPRDCESCHDTSAWGNARPFNHSFPIYSGAHREGAAWDDCADCHPNASNFSVFDCKACHSSSEMQEEHDDVGGYVYQNSECLACHPDGREDD